MERATRTGKDTGRNLAADISKAMTLNALLWWQAICPSWIHLVGREGKATITKA